MFSQLKKTKVTDIASSDSPNSLTPQGASKDYAKPQLSGVSPQFGAPRTKVVLAGNVSEIENGYDDSILGKKSNKNTPRTSSIGALVAKTNNASAINFLDPKIEGTYSGADNATFRVKIVNHEDPLFCPVANPVYNGSFGLNDLSVITKNITEIDQSGVEKVVTPASRYVSNYVTVYKVEIAHVSSTSEDTIRWYKNGVLATQPGNEQKIDIFNGNIFVDGDNSIVIKFKFNGITGIKYGTVIKHNPGDSWTIVAGSQQIRWIKGTFPDPSGVSMVPIKNSIYKEGGPIGIVANSSQLLVDGIYIKFPSSAGYPDGSSPNIPAAMWEFKVTAAKSNASISSMQESSGKIQVYPDHRVEQRDLGQTNSSRVYDKAEVEQHQIFEIEIKNLEEIGSQELYSRTSAGNTQLYDGITEKKKYVKNVTLEYCNEFDKKLGLPITGSINDKDIADPINRGWKFSDISSDGSIGPYFLAYSLEKQATSKTIHKNHFWFNFGNTSTSDITLYDDKDPKPQASDGIQVDISGRELSEIVFPGNDELQQNAMYQISNIAAMSIIDFPEGGNKNYWSNDGGRTMVLPNNIHSGGWPTSTNSKGQKLYYLISTDKLNYVTAPTAGWKPDRDIGSPEPKMSTDIKGNFLQSALTQDDWMTYHGYAIASISEVDWMLREGFKPYQDVLHNKWFTLYTSDFEAYYFQFNVIDNIDGILLQDISADVDDDKSVTVPKKVIVRINRYNTASEISKKLQKRIARKLSSNFSASEGYDVSSIFSAKVINGNSTDITVKKFGKVEEPDVPDDLISANFKCIKKIEGRLGYAQMVLDNVSATKEVYKVGRCLCIYNATAYGSVPPYSPHVIWFNLDGDCIAPAGANGLVAKTGFSSTAGLLSSLTTYDFDAKYADDIDEAFSAGRVIEVTIFSKSAGSSISYQFSSAINNNEKFKIPFISIRPSNNNISRILQRDPGPILTASEEIPNQTCHKINLNVSINNLRPGILANPSTLRDRNYISDSLVFAVKDSILASSRFSIEKKVVKNFAKFQIKCVDEQKSGMLFDYSDQTWLDPDPDVTSELARTRKGGSADLSNYETNVLELFNNIPQKEISGSKIWKRVVGSEEQITAADFGYAGVDNLESNYDSKNRELWANNVIAGSRIVTTNFEQGGLSDPQMISAGWFRVGDPGWSNITESEWMEHEGFEPVPAFTHKVAKATYFLLPHPEKNFYVWFDVGQLSADPGDDGALDSTIGIDLNDDDDVSYNGGAIRVAVQSYDTAKDIAKKLVDRINSDLYDAGKKFVQVNVESDGRPIYQQLNAGNLSTHFIAEIDSEDLSIVNITCKKSGLINKNVFNENESLNFPVTESGDKFAITMLNNGDSVFSVKLKNKVPGYVYPPLSKIPIKLPETLKTSVKLPKIDPINIPGLLANLPIAVPQVPFSKKVDKFIPHEDMDRLENGQIGNVITAPDSTNTTINSSPSLSNSVNVGGKFSNLSQSSRRFNGGRMIP